MIIIEAIVIKKKKKINFDEAGIWCKWMTTGYQSKSFVPNSKKEIRKEEVKKEIQGRSRTKHEEM